MQTEQNFDTLKCSICLGCYDTYGHIPKLLPNCSHVVCKSCLQYLLNNPNQRKCPLCRYPFSSPLKSANDFKTSIHLVDILEHIEREKKRHECPIHKMAMDWFCLSDGRQLCEFCKFKKHKDHNVQTMKEIRIQANDKILSLTANKEKLIQCMGKSYGPFGDKKDTLLKCVGAKFDEMRQLLVKMEKELYLEIDGVYEEANKAKEYSEKDYHFLVGELEQLPYDLKQPSMTSSFMEALEKKIETPPLNPEFERELKKIIEFNETCKNGLEGMLKGFDSLSNPINEQVEQIFDLISNPLIEVDDDKALMLEMKSILSRKFMENYEIRGFENYEIIIEAKTHKSIKDTLSNLLKNIIDSKGAHLVKMLVLDLEHCNEFVNDDVIKEMSSQLQTHALKLDKMELIFSGCKFITDVGLEHLCNILETKEAEIQHSHLTHLSLNFRGCEQINSAGLSKLSNTISKYNIQLQFIYLSFQDCNLLVDEGVQAIGLVIQVICQNLQYLGLNFPGCKNITDIGVMILLACILNSKAQLINLNLDVSRCAKISYITMGKICQAISVNELRCNKQLQKLTLGLSK